MNKSRKSLSVSECKIQASILLKSMRAKDTEDVKHNVKLKDALVIIARKHGFKSWTDLKSQLPMIRGGFLNQWFSHYEEAKSYLQSHQGFLLPYKNQFFICDENYIAFLGLDSKDPDWKLINYDWINPVNKEAFRRLYKKWMQIVEKLS